MFYQEQQSIEKKGKSFKKDQTHQMYTGNVQARVDLWFFLALGSGEPHFPFQQRRKRHKKVN